LSVFLDFQSVSGIDSSAAMAFAKTFEMARARGARITLINLGSRIEAIFRRCVGSEAMTDISVFALRDVALEAREKFILDRVHGNGAVAHTASDVLSRLGLDSGEIGDLMGFFEQHEVRAGEVVFRQGEKADSMLIVDSGEFEVLLEAADGGTIRIRKVIAGATLGEMGIYLGTRRTTSVRATTDGQVMVLDRAALTRMHTERAALALKFNRFIIGVLADRLNLSNGEVLELSSASPQ
jgi:hypothetical protein